jgi:hypothetical protein
MVSRPDRHDPKFERRGETEKGKEPVAREGVDMRAMLLVVALATAAAWAGDAPDDDAQIRKLIQQLGDEDFAAREAADMALRKLGILAVSALRAARGEAKDAEVVKRVEGLLEIWPPERKERTTQELTTADTAETVRALYDEWLAEHKRCQFLTGYHRLRCLGFVYTNTVAIEADLGALLRIRPLNTLDAIKSLEEAYRRERGDVTSPGAESPIRFLARVGGFARRQQAAQRTGTLSAECAALLERQEPPTAAEWLKVRPDLRDTPTV